MCIFEILNYFTDSKYLLERIDLNPMPVGLRTWELFIMNFNPTNYTFNNPIEEALREINSRDINLFNMSTFSIKRYFKQLEIFMSF